MPEREARRLKGFPKKDMWKVAFEPECRESPGVCRQKHSRPVPVSEPPAKRKIRRQDKGQFTGETKVVPR